MTVSGGVRRREDKTQGSAMHQFEELRWIMAEISFRTKNCIIGR